jgi:hypothetical protein
VGSVAGGAPVVAARGAVAWLLTAGVGMPLIFVLAIAGLPDRTPAIVICTPAIVIGLVLIMDDAVGRYVKRWSAQPAGAGDGKASGWLAVSFVQTLQPAAARALFLVHPLTTRPRWSTLTAL